MQTLELPSGAIWQTVEPLSSAAAGLGGAYLPTTPAEFSTAFSRAIGALSPDVRLELAATNEDVAVAVDGFESIIEAVTSQPPGIAMLGEVASVFADVIGHFVEGSGVLDSMVSELSADIGDAAEAIPFIGTLVKIVTHAVAIATIPEVTAEQLAVIKSLFRSYCSKRAESVVEGTGPYNQVEMADLFAQDDSRVRVWRWLAGGASRDPAVRGAYASWLAAAKPKYGITGIPLYIQEQMVLLMEGIYAARRPLLPELGAPIIGDNGRALGAVLMQITVDQGSKSARGLGKNAYTLASLRSLADNFVAPPKTICTTPIPGQLSAPCETFSACRTEGIVDVGRAFYRFVTGWDTAVRDPQNRALASASVSSSAKTGALLLTPALTQALLGTLGKTKTAAELEAERRRADRNSRRWAIGLSTLIAGGGAFWLARRAAARG